jgi:hypothetical protein
MFDPWGGSTMVFEVLSYTSVNLQEPVISALVPFFLQAEKIKMKMKPVKRNRFMTA